MKSKYIAQRVAYMSQGRNVPDMTVGQLVLHGRFAHLNYPRVYSEKDKQIATLAMRQSGVDHLAGKMMGTLSGGMRQNAYIAMTLAQDTDYILADEPTTYLDVYNQLQLMKTLKKLANDGKGIIVVMHDIALAMQYSDKIVVMKDGKFTESGTPENIFNSGIVNDAFGVELKRIKTDNGFVYYMS